MRKGLLVFCMCRWRLYLLAFFLPLLFACTKQSFISSTSEMHWSDQPIKNVKFTAGVVIDSALTNTIIYATNVHGDLTYVFEFKIGQDVARYLPECLRRHFKQLNVVRSPKESDEPVDFVLIPDVSASKLNLWIRSSAAPSYILSINLRIKVLKNGQPYDEINITKVGKNDIPAFHNTDSERDELLRRHSESLLREVFSTLDSRLNGMLATYRGEGGVLQHLGLWETHNQRPPAHDLPHAANDLTYDDLYSQIPPIDYWPQ
jgi:hypothetical protein